MTKKGKLNKAQEVMDIMFKKNDNDDIVFSNFDIKKISPKLCKEIISVTNTINPHNDYFYKSYATKAVNIMAEYEGINYTDEQFDAHLENEIEDMISHDIDNGQLEYINGNYYSPEQMYKDLKFLARHED